MLTGDSEGYCPVRRWARQGILGIIRSPLFPWHKTTFSWATYWDKPVSSWVQAWPSAGRLYVSLNKHPSLSASVSTHVSKAYLNRMLQYQPSPWFSYHFLLFLTLAASDCSCHLPVGNTQVWEIAVVLQECLRTCVYMPCTWMHQHSFVTHIRSVLSDF